MSKRRYYSERTGNRTVEVDLTAFKKIFVSLFEELDYKQYFDEILGVDCPDDPDNDKRYSNAESFFLRKLRKDNLWPITSENSIKWSEEDFFDIIEFLYDHVSVPIEDSQANLHSFYDHYHYTNFDNKSGQDEFREIINEYLNDYGEGYELSNNGEIHGLLKEEFRPLIETHFPTNDPENIEAKIRKSINKFRKYGSTIDDRKEAIRDLADCLEFVRPKLKKVISKNDESDLFNIINNFGIRHHNEKQKTNYNQSIWLSWMFYYYLATLHAVLRFIDVQEDPEEN